MREMVRATLTLARWSDWSSQFLGTGDVRLRPGIIHLVRPVQIP
jgi:hypothetical protein